MICEPANPRLVEVGLLREALSPSGWWSHARRHDECLVWGLDQKQMDFAGPLGSHIQAPWHPFLAWSCSQLVVQCRPPERLAVLAPSCPLLGLPKCGMYKGYTWRGSERWLSMVVLNVSLWSCGPVWQCVIIVTCAHSQLVAWTCML